MSPSDARQFVTALAHGLDFLNVFQTGETLLCFNLKASRSRLSDQHVVAV
jgi:hypothetical protein